MEYWWNDLEPDFTDEGDGQTYRDYYARQRGKKWEYAIILRSDGDGYGISATILSDGSIVVIEEDDYEDLDTGDEDEGDTEDNED